MTVRIAFGSAGWKYVIGASGFDPGFQVKGYDDSAWSTGTAAFGSTGAWTPTPVTCWPTDCSNTFQAAQAEILLRKFTTLNGVNRLIAVRGTNIPPGGSFDPGYLDIQVSDGGANGACTLEVKVDNYATVYVDGIQLQGPGGGVSAAPPGTFGLTSEAGSGPIPESTGSPFSFYPNRLTKLNTLRLPRQTMDVL